MSEEKKKKWDFDSEEYKKMIKVNTERTELASEVNTKWTPDVPEPSPAPDTDTPPKSLHQRIEEDTTLTGTARAILEKTLRNPRVDTEDDS
jgi:hypothetical protein|tara:strand:+ start:437 stop:709 length:273 start_codon:yes stop_codon:yes gene_type:complete